MKRGSREQGQIAVTVALLLVVMLGFAALASDMGFLYSSRTGAQAIADAAALAGAASFIFSPRATQPDTAEARATATATAQDILSDSVVTGEVSVNVDTDLQQVTVTLDRNEDTFFGRALGINDARVLVSGTAEAALTASGSGCTKPWFIPNTVLMDTGACSGLHGRALTDCYANMVCEPCTFETDEEKAASELLVYADASGNFQVTEHAQELLALAPPLITIRPTVPSDSLSPGQFYSMRLGDSTGGNDYRTNIRTCAGEQTYCGNCYEVEPGNMIGPTNQGVGDLLGANPDTFSWNAETQVATFCNDGDCSFTSRQLVIAPIWDVCNTPAIGACPSEDFCADEDADGVPDAHFAGTPSLRIVAYAVIFVNGWSGSNLQAYLLDVKVCSSGGPITDDNGNNQTGPLAVPLRLVNPNAAPGG